MFLLLSYVAGRELDRGCPNLQAALSLVGLPALNASMPAPWLAADEEE